MIAISNYVEPVVNPVAVNDLPQVNEPEKKEENQEKGSFAELLAGLLRNSENSQEIPVVEFSDGNVDLELTAMQKLNLLKETEIQEKTEFSDTKVPLEDLINFAGAQNITDLEAADTKEGEFYQELSNLIRTDLAPEADLDADFFAVENNSFLDAEALAAKNAAQATAQEAIANAENKKDRAQKQPTITSENIEALAGKNELAEASANLRKDQSVNEKPGKLEEKRNAALRDRSRRDGFSLEVRDMRTVQPFAAVETAATRTGGDSSVRELTLELRLPNNNSAIQQSNTSWEAKAGSALENLLARELHQSFNGDIVRHASMALKDGGEGTIKLALKPESLGNVKIALELSDNKITGRIFVESQEALNAFRKEIASLEQAFKDSGFAAADLNLSLTSQGQNQEGWDKTSFVPTAIASRYEDNSERIESESAINIVNVFIGQRKSAINMLA